MTLKSQRFYAFCRTKTWTLIKMKRNQKWEIPYTVLERRTLCFSSCKNCKIKVKLWWVRAREGKKILFLVPFSLSEGNLFGICVLSQCIVYWIHFENIHTFTYQKTLLHLIFCLFLKSLKAFSVSLSIVQSDFYQIWVSCHYNKKEMINALEICIMPPFHDIQSLVLFYNSVCNI